MVAVPIPHPSQTQGYHGRFQESFVEPPPRREYSYQRPEPAAYQAPAPQQQEQPRYQNQYQPAPPMVEPEAPQSAAPAPAPALTTPALAELMKDQDWMNVLAAGTLLAGGALLVSGHKRAGLMVAAAGTALALMEEKEAIEVLWKKLPGFLREAQSFVDKAEGYMKDAGITV